MFCFEGGYGRGNEDGTIGGRGNTLNVRVLMEEMIESRMKPERIALEPSSAGTGPGAPGQQCLLSSEMQRGETTSFEGFVLGVELNDQASPFASSCKIVFLQLSCQSQYKVIMGKEENTQFDPGG